MLTTEEERYFQEEQALHEGKYLAGENPRQQSGFGRDEADWKRFRRAVAEPIAKSGSFLDIGCANGLLMESVVAWAAEVGHRIEPYGLDISKRLAEVAQRRLPQWRDRIFVGNALFWIRLRGSISSEQSLSTFQAPAAVNISNDSLNVWWHPADG